MQVTVASHAHRKLRQLERYFSASEMAQSHAAVFEQSSTPVDTVVGCYQNDGGSTTDWIIFTTEGVSAVFQGTWQHIPYAEIERVVRDEIKDSDTDEVCLKLRSKRHAVLRVSGKETEYGTHDKFMIMMFFESAIGIKHVPE